jgi:hypothetical protein
MDRGSGLLDGRNAARAGSSPPGDRAERPRADRSAIVAGALGGAPGMGRLRAGRLVDSVTIANTRTVESCATVNNILFNDGFESGGLSRWNPSPP